MNEPDEPQRTEEDRLSWRHALQLMRERLMPSSAEEIEKIAELGNN